MFAGRGGMLRMSHCLPSLFLLSAFLIQTMARLERIFLVISVQKFLYNDLLRMSETDEQDFMADYVTWMKGLGLDQKSLHVYNFGYDRALPFPSIALTPDRQSGALSLVEILEILCSHWLDLTMLAPRSMPQQRTSRHSKYILQAFCAFCCVVMA